MQKSLYAFSKVHEFTKKLTDCYRVFKDLTFKFDKVLGIKFLKFRSLSCENLLSNAHSIKGYFLFIQTEETPNPNSLKFLPGQEVRGKNPPVSFSSVDECSLFPFAKRLLFIEGVDEVFLGSDFITITKKQDQEWYVLKPLIFGTLMETFVNGLPISLDSSCDDHSIPLSDDPVVHKIRELLDTRIRPAVAQDGGDITFESFEEGIVYLRMKGACSGCPSSSATLKSGVENMLKHYVPEVLEVRQVND